MDRERRTNLDPHGPSARMVRALRALIGPDDESIRQRSDLDHAEHLVRHRLSPADTIREAKRKGIAEGQVAALMDFALQAAAGVR